MPASHHPLVLAIVVITTTCQLSCLSPPEPIDLLEPAQVEQVAKQVGDATGDTWDGNYLSKSNLVDCDCPPLGQPNADNSAVLDDELLDLCAAITVSTEELVIPIEVSQAGGTLKISQPGLVEREFIGSVSNDGTFAVSDIYNLYNIASLAEIDIYSRLDGSFKTKNENATFEGEQQSRFIGNYFDEEIDCRAISIISGEQTKLEF